MRLYPDRHVFYAASAVVFIAGVISTLLLAYLVFLDDDSNAYNVVDMGIIFWPFVGGFSGAYYFLSNLKNIIDIDDNSACVQRGGLNTERKIPVGDVMLGRNVMLIGSALIHLRIGDRWICYKDANNEPISSEFFESIGVKKRNEFSILMSLVKQGSIFSIMFIAWALVGSYLFVFGLP